MKVTLWLETIPSSLVKRFACVVKSPKDHSVFFCIHQEKCIFKLVDTDDVVITEDDIL